MSSTFSSVLPSLVMNPWGEPFFFQPQLRRSKSTPYKHNSTQTSAMKSQLWTLFVFKEGKFSCFKIHRLSRPTKFDLFTYFGFARVTWIMSRRCRTSRAHCQVLRDRRCQVAVLPISSPNFPCSLFWLIFKPLLGDLVFILKPDICYLVVYRPDQLKC
jgi:hypothetical protein